CGNAASGVNHPRHSRCESHHLQSASPDSTSPASVSKATLIVFAETPGRTRPFTNPDCSSATKAPRQTREQIGLWHIESALPRRRKANYYQGPRPNRLHASFVFHCVLVVCLFLRSFHLP